MSDTQTIRYVTPEATLMWAWLFKPRPPKAGKAGDPTFMCDLVFGPEALETPEFKAMMAAYQKAATEKFGDRLQALIQAEKFIKPFWKNERKVDENGKLRDGYPPGGYYVTLKSKHRPGIVQAGPEGVVPIIDEEALYPGCRVRASVDCYAYDNESKGVSFGLYNVMKVGEGQRLGGGRTDPKDDFAKYATAPASAAPGGTASPGSLFL